MPKNQMQDIVPKGSHSIRNIPIPEGRIRHSGAVEEDSAHFTNGELDQETVKKARYEFESSTEDTENKKHTWKKAWWAIAIVAVILAAFLIVNAFKSATISVTPRTLAAVIQRDYAAKKAATSSDLPFQVITLKETESQTVSATGEEQVDTHATGTIVIYNNYSTTAQRLIKNTRFETPEGLIYRIQDSITVPGKKGTTPGSIEAMVVADESGVKYNVGLKDFTIPGFKGDPRFNSFYARSKTPLAGGYSGIMKVVADADRKKAQDSIHTKLATTLLKQVEANKSADVVFFDNAYALSFAPLPQENVSDSQVLIKEEGTLTAVVFDKKALSSFVAKDYVKDYADDSIIINNLDSISFTPKGDFRPATDQSISFTLSGNATFEWIYDEAALKEALLGKSRSDVPSIIQKFPMIEKVDTAIRPVWSKSIPNSLKLITIKKVL